MASKKQIDRWRKKKYSLSCSLCFPYPKEKVFRFPEKWIGKLEEIRLAPPLYQTNLLPFSLFHLRYFSPSLSLSPPLFPDFTDVFKKRIYCSRQFRMLKNDRWFNMLEKWWQWREERDYKWSFVEEENGYRKKRRVKRVVGGKKAGCEGLKF